MSSEVLVRFFPELGESDSSVMERVSLCRKAWDHFKAIMDQQKDSDLLILLSVGGWKEDWPWSFTHNDFPGVVIQNRTVECNEERPWEVLG